MNIVRYTTGGVTEFGALEGDELYAVEGSFARGFRRGAALGSGEVQLEVPVVPRTIVAVGRNYALHAAELGNALPETPMVFFKAVSALLAPGETIVHPRASTRVEHEGELAVVIGRSARNVAADDALEYVAGYTLANDVTARDLQKGPTGLTLAKAFDTFCPLGPWVLTRDEVPDPADLVVSCHVNGELRQDGSKESMVFSVAELISYISGFVTLVPGDVVLTGTPSGVGALQVGDEVTVSAPGLGELTNTVVAELGGRR